MFWIFVKIPDMNESKSHIGNEVNMRFYKSPSLQGEKV